MRINKLLVLFIVLAFTLPQSSFAKKGYLKEKPEEPNLSIVYGYIDMDEAPIKLKWISMKRVKPRTSKPYYNFWTTKGLFYRASVPQGAYKFDSFGGFSGWKNTDYTFEFPKQGRGELDPTIKKQGIYFVGAYKYKKIKTGLLRASKYDLVKVASPTEKELLLQLSEYARHPEWKGLIDRRLKELK